MTSRQLPGIKHLVIGLLALVFLPLSGPLFWCHCHGRVVTVPELDAGHSCCDAPAEADREPAPADCPEDAGRPCGETFELAFAAPERWGCESKGDCVSIPPSVLLVTEALPNPPPLLALRDRGEAHPPPGAIRRHLRFRILLI